jgi:hypothetical protein
MRAVVTFLLLLVIITWQSSLASAQSLDELREDVREVADDVNRIGVFQAITFFSAAPGISGSSYRFSDDDPETSANYTNLIKLPISRDLGDCGFVPRESQVDDGWAAQQVRNAQREAALNCIRPYGELSLSYLRSTEDDVDAVLFEDTEIDFDLTTFTAQAGFGLAIPVMNSLTFRPILLMGYSHIVEDADINGAFADEFEQAAGGIFFGFEANSFLLGGAAELEHQASIADDATLQSTLRYDHIVSDTFDASDEVLESTNDYGIWTANVRGKKTTDLTLFSREVAFTGSLGGAYFPGDTGDELLTDYFTDAGLGVEIKEDGIVNGIEGFSLSGRYIWGPDVTGYSFGLSLVF